MFEKDYLLRLLVDFMNALNRIINSIDKDDVEGAKIQIQNAYRLLGNDFEFFTTSDFDDIIGNFKMQEGNYLKRVEMLAELMSLDAKLQTDKERRLKLVKTAIRLHEHFIENSKEYSFKMETSLEEIQKLFSSDKL